MCVTPSCLLTNPNEVSLSVPLVQYCGRPGSAARALSVSFPLRIFSMSLFVISCVVRCW